MEITCLTILKGNINDNLWPKIILAITYVKNFRLTKALEGGKPYQALNKKKPDLSYLQILVSTVYVLIHKEEYTLKSEKWPYKLFGKGR